LYQWGDAIEVRGDPEVKRLGTPALSKTKKGALEKLELS
jgi:hypothetical protein